MLKDFKLTEPALPLADKKNQMAGDGGVHSRKYMARTEGTSLEIISLQASPNFYRKKSVLPVVCSYVLDHKLVSRSSNVVNESFVFKKAQLRESRSF